MESPSTNFRKYTEQILATQKFERHLTYQGNLKNTRYGWLRLTPAYSIHVVSDILAEDNTGDTSVLDPFCGTGTTALVCAEKGIHCDTTDINPFLLWLTTTKTNLYSTSDIESFRHAAHAIFKIFNSSCHEQYWTPSIHQIEKWWSPETLNQLAKAIQIIHEYAPKISKKASDLLKIAFCRTLIEESNASFNHQSMSFKKQEAISILPFMDLQPQIANTWDNAVNAIANSAITPIRQVPEAKLCDARFLEASLPLERYSHIITSPPYPNRISYIRELRPYMYWLGYLTSGREAGELDWQAMGGTWGCATSNLNKWNPDPNSSLPFDDFQEILSRISIHSPILAKYVEKYFYDMLTHCYQAMKVVKHGGSIHYVVGNSKFFDQVVPVEKMFAAMFESVGFVDVHISILRKRSSKKELLEFLVSAKKP